MAKFVTADGKGGISGDKLMLQLQRGELIPESSYPTSYYRISQEDHTNIEKLSIPVGGKNRDRLNNINIYDVLVHIQKTLSLTGKCIIEMITNEDHKCPNMNDEIQQRIRKCAMDGITDDFRYVYPRSMMRVKKDDSDELTTRPETDEEWNDRLCHTYMHRYEPTKFQQIKCEYCLQQWLNDDKW